jgi:hypothetical protein
MPMKKLAEKFQRIDKRSVRGKVKHTRTGACTAKGKCYHGKKKT